MTIVSPEKLVVVATDGLGVVHGRAGILEHRIGAAAIIGIDADANAECHVEFVSADALWLGKDLQKLVGDTGSILDLLDFGQQDDELVAPPPAHGVRRPHTGREALRHRL